MESRTDAVEPCVLFSVLPERAVAGDGVGAPVDLDAEARLAVPGGRERFRKWGQNRRHEVACGVHVVVTGGGQQDQCHGHDGMRAVEARPGRATTRRTTRG